METKWEQIGRLLWQNEYNRVLPEILLQLEKNANPDRSEKERERLFYYVFKTIGGNHDLEWPKIADIFQALVIFDPLNVEQLLDITVKVLTADEWDQSQVFIYQLAQKRPAWEKRAFNFVNGIILGIFQAAIWFDDNPLPPHKFEQKLISVLPDIMLKIKNTGHFDTKFESELSSKVKKYCRPFHQKGHRIYQLQQIFDNIGPNVDAIASDSNRWGMLLLNQLCFAIFGSINPQGRVKAIDLLFTAIRPEGIKPIDSLVAETTSASTEQKAAPAETENNPSE